jgi:hypothetical protein
MQVVVVARLAAADLVLLVLAAQVVAVLVAHQQVTGLLAALIPAVVGVAALVMLHPIQTAVTAAPASSFSR